MPTVIKFSGSDLTITVAQSPDEVSRAVADANGGPLQLDMIERGQRVFVNPDVVACWHELENQISPGRMISS
jgi:hypothetical protein